MSGVPGRGGPVPKRQAQRRRANKPEAEVRSAPAAPAAKAQPPAAARDWHPIARRWYKALAESGQSVYYEPSDWATAYLLAEVISRELQPVGLQNPDLDGDLHVCLPDGACVGQAGRSWCGRCSTP